MQSSSVATRRCACRGDAQSHQDPSGQDWLQESLWNPRCLQLPIHTKIYHICHTPHHLGADWVEDRNVNSWSCRNFCNVIVTLTSFWSAEVSAAVCCAHITADTSSILMWKKPCVVLRYTGAAVQPKLTAMGALVFPFKLNWSKLIVNLKLQYQNCPKIKDKTLKGNYS